MVVGTYALTAAITYSDGAWGVMYKIRNNKAIKYFGLLECFLCSSAWVAALLSFSFGYGLEGLLIGWGGSVIIDKIITIYMVK